MQIYEFTENKHTFWMHSLILLYYYIGTYITYTVGIKINGIYLSNKYIVKLENQCLRAE